MVMKVVTLNVRGFRSAAKQLRVKGILESLNVDIALLQETHFSSCSDVAALQKILPWKGIHSFGTRLSAGVAALVAPTFQGRVVKFARDVQGRVLTLDVARGGRLLRLANVYAPNEYRERNDFFANLGGYLNGRRDLLVAGDFNCVLDQARDVIGGTQRYQPWKGRELQRLVNAGALVDAWRHLHNGTPVFTFAAQGRQARLDRFYLSSSLVTSAQDCDVIQVGTPFSYVSDHAAVLLTLRDLQGFGAQRLSWRLNIRLLEDEEVVKDVRRLIERHLAHPSRSGEWWDDLKTEVRLRFQEWGRRRAADRRKDLSIVQWGLRSLLQTGLVTAAEREEYAALQADLRTLLAASVRESPGRTATKRRGDNPPSEERNSSKVSSTMEQLYRNDGTTTSSLDEMTALCEQYYTRLYARRHVDSSTWDHWSERLPSLWQTFADELDIDASCEDLQQAMLKISKGKAAGSDGLPIEFYHKFCDLLGRPLLAVFKSALADGVLPSSAREGHIKLICKDDSRAKDLSAWRPITLLNADYKIWAKTLQLRMARAMEDLVSTTQVCAVPGRSIAQHLSAIRDIAYWVADRKSSALILTVDQEKAFDRIDHGFLMHLMRHYGFGDLMLKWIALLYTRITSRVIVNGRASAPFPVQAGVRQGCPVSPLLFVLVFDAALRQLSRPEVVPRLPVPGSQHHPTIFAYADDLTVVTTSEDAVKQVVHVLQEYGKASGARVNAAKSTVMRWGSVGAEGEVAGIPVRTSAKILGINFSATGPLIGNWITAARDAQQQSRDWQALELDFRARSEVIKSRMCSRWWYHGAVFQPNPEVTRRLHKIMFHLFWSGRPERVRRAVMVQPPERGGLGLPDVQLFCAALGIHTTFRVLDDSTHIAAHLAEFFLSTRITAFGRRFDRTQPHAADVYPFYDIVWNRLHEIQQVNPDGATSLWSVKELYSALRDNRYPVRDQAMDRGRLVSNLLEGSRVDVLWQHSHVILPVRTRLYRFGISRTNVCPRCGRPENHFHVFYECPVAAAMWRRVATVFKLPRVSYTTVQTLDPLPVHPSKAPAFCLTVSEVSYQLWCSRTRACYGAMPDDLRTVTFAVRLALRSRLQRELEGNTRATFKKKWRKHYDLFLVSGRFVRILF